MTTNTGTSLEGLIEAAGAVGDGLLSALTGVGASTGSTSERRVLPRDPQHLWRPLAELPERLVTMASGSLKISEHERTALNDADAQIVAQLALPTPLLLLMGSDERTEPVDGVNRYGFPAYEDRELIQFSSCTATVPDASAVATASSYRTAALRKARTDAVGTVREMRTTVVAELADILGLPASVAENLVLCPSGTDAELLPIAIALHAKGRPVRNIYVGAREAGSGVAVAGSGCWPGNRTALGWQVSAGDAVDGIGSDLIRVTHVDIRDARGRARRAFDVEAEVEAHVEDALSSELSVIVHAMEGSKTGLRFLPPEWVERFQLRAPEHLRVVVDAAQGRIAPARVKAFLAAGASVLLTGSKAWSGPPFAGVLAPSAAMQNDMRACGSLPDGLAQAFTQTDLPPSLPRAHRNLLPSNVGLLIRWMVALDEVRRYQAVPLTDRGRLQTETAGRLFAALSRESSLEVLTPPGDDPSIVTFAVRSGRHSYASREELGALHRSAAAKGLFLGQPVDVAPDCPAMLRAAVGAATVTRLHDRGGSDRVQRTVDQMMELLLSELQTVRT